jgi:hypothetical protein
MPKMKVTATGEKPHSVWYSGYKGVGALEPARNETVTDASRKNAVRSERTQVAATLGRAGVSVEAAVAQFMAISRSDRSESEKRKTDE